MGGGKEGRRKGGKREKKGREREKKRRKGGKRRRKAGRKRRKHSFIHLLPPTLLLLSGYFAECWILEFICLC